MGTKIHIVNAFANNKFKGNPAGIYFSDKNIEVSKIQKIAHEFNLPIISVIQKIHDKLYSIKWYTKNSEINLCGHGTLAASYWLYKEFGYQEVKYTSNSGILTSKVLEDETVELNFPSQKTKKCNNSTKYEIERLLGLSIKNCFYGYEDYLLELESSDDIVNYNPNFKKISEIKCRGIIITGLDKTNTYDCISRFFCPRIAINEDQVCVSAHCKILPFLNEKYDLNKIHAYQASINGGELHLTLLENNRIRIVGSALRKNSLFYSFNN